MLDKPKREPKPYVTPEEQVAINVQRYIKSRISMARWRVIHAEERAAAWEKVGSDLLRKYAPEYDPYPMAVYPDGTVSS
jgi:hypothetical protein